MNIDTVKYLAALVTLLPFCAKQSAAFQDGTRKSEINIDYISAVNEFGFKLLKTLASREPEKNIFISPVSIFYALSIINNGAAGATETSIKTALQLQEFTQDRINKSNSLLMNLLMVPDSSAELNIANSLWLNEPFELKPEFVKDCNEQYSVETFVKDFAQPSATEEINEWVRNKTHGKIDKIIDQFKKDDLLVILNAIYFNGEWTKPFETIQTEMMPFMLLGGSEKKYPRMHQYGTFEYFESSEFQLVSIPYGKRFSMCIVLPQEREGIHLFLEGLSTAGWSRATSAVSRRYGLIGVPKYKINYAASLVDVLKSFGMSIAFDGGADFSRMTQSSVMISDVIHKTYLDVNEEGTEAAAITLLDVCATMPLRSDPPKPFEMIVDHPFFFAIVDDETGLILFVGAIVDPKSDTK